MARWMTTAALIVCLTVAGAWIGVATSSAQPQNLPRPNTPLAHVGGDSVSLAFTLPERPRVEQVQVLRAEKGGTTFVVLAELPPTELAYTDTTVTAGTTYLYAIRTRARDVSSEPSRPAEVSIRGTDTLTLLGGSLERAWFEVAVFREGRRFSSRFVHRSGEVIGDLVYSPEAEGPVDLRLGAMLLRLELTEETATETERIVLRETHGGTMRGPSGREIALDFEFPVEQHESIRATIQLGEDTLALTPGETVTLD
jgi:hypothetical protein